MNSERKFNDGESVVHNDFTFRMIVISAEHCIGGWRYKLGIPKTANPNEVDKRISPRFYFERDLHNFVF